jgi:hypothetical protein
VFRGYRLSRQRLCRRRVTELSNRERRETREREMGKECSYPSRFRVFGVFRGYRLSRQRLCRRRVTELSNRERRETREREMGKECSYPSRFRVFGVFRGYRLSRQRLCHRRATELSNREMRGRKGDTTLHPRLFLRVLGEERSTGGGVSVGLLILNRELRELRENERGKECCYPSLFRVFGVFRGFTFVTTRWNQRNNRPRRQRHTAPSDRC